MLPTPPPSWPLPLSPLGIRFISKGYSCILIKDRNKTTCIYTAQAAPPPKAFKSYAALQN